MDDRAASFAYTCFQRARLVLSEGTHATRTRESMIRCIVSQAFGNQLEEEVISMDKIELTLYLTMSR